MQSRELVSGFSDLKELLIRTYKIERDRELVKLYFSEKDNELLMHDHDDHAKLITICSSITTRKIRRTILTSRAILIIEASLDQAHPSGFLNVGFNLHGFFKP